MIARPRLRIAHVSATFPPYRGGGGNVCFHNARELARRGHEVHVFTARLAGAPASQTVEDIQVHRLRPLLQIGNAPLTLQLPRYLDGFDIVHLHYPFIWGAELARLGAAIFRTPLIVTLHNDLIGDGARAQLFAAYQRLSARLTVSASAALCVVSMDHYLHSRLRRALGRHAPQVVEMANGVDTELFQPRGRGVRRRCRIPDDAALILFVAALDRAHHFKGLEQLLEATARLSPQTWLLVIGDGDLRPVYEQQAKALGIADRTVFAGAVDNEETPPFYRSADITVLPSTPPESFGLVLIESLACSTPAVASDIPGVRTVVSSGIDGLLARPGDAEDLAQKMAHLINLPAEQRMAMGRAGRRKVQEKYAWPRIGDRLEELYDQVVSGRPIEEQRPTVEAMP